MAEIVLRPATDADVAALVRLWFDTWHATSPDLEHPDPFDHWEQRFRTEILPRETVLVAELDGKISGFMALREHEAYLHSLYVLPTAQQHGVGSRFLEEAMRRCPNGLQLSTLKSNHRARAFYERHGWEPGEEVPHPRSGHPNIVYRWSPGISAGS
jgi:ribosomal protein S18 acetylase RimI-like enzyme